MCERPGGYGANHRRVRRQEEIIWIREQGFTCVVTLIPSPHNLHNYDELGVAWRHLPFGRTTTPERWPRTLFPELADMLAGGGKVLVHQDELSDRVAGLMAGYLLWAGVVPLAPQATSVVERLLSRQMGPLGRDLVAMASTSRTSQQMGADDRIELRGLRLSGIVGVLPHERVTPQPLEVDVDLQLDLGPAAASDDLVDTVDYGAVCDAIESVVSTTQFELLEALGSAVAAAVLAVDPRVGQVTVALRKLEPPTSQQLATSGVRLTRSQP